MSTIPPLNLPVGLIELDQAEMLAEARANTHAIVQVIDAVGKDTTTSAVFQSSLQSVKAAFGWDYGACWMIDEAIQATSFAAEAGNLGPAYDVVNQTNHYKKGQGITGRTWAAADVVFIPDLSIIKDSELVRTARAAGAIATISIPFIVQNKVIGVLFFFSFREIQPSPDRFDALRNIGRLVGQAYHRLQNLEKEKREREALSMGADQILAIVRAAQSGDLTQSMPAIEDPAMHQVADGLGEFFRGLRTSIRSIVTTANALSESAAMLGRLSRAMEERAGGTSATSLAASAESIVVSEKINSIAAGSNQMVSSIRLLSGNATQASAKFQNAVRAGVSARDSIGKLTASSKDIKAIVKVVHTISRQTNMLALNASIEATRAGSAGRAFMVVATEVKELAKEAATATERINDGIEVIQQDTELAVGLIAEITAIVDDVSRISESIANTAVEQSMTTTEIGRHVSDAAVGSSSIARKIAEVAEVAQGAQKEARETNVAAQSLEQMANALHTLVRRFRVD